MTLTLAVGLALVLVLALIILMLYVPRAERFIYLAVLAMAAVWLARALFLHYSPR